MELNAYPYFCVSQTRTLISYVVVFFMFNDLMLEVCFVEIGGIVDHHCLSYRIDGVMVGVLASSKVNREFQPQLGQTKDYQIGICCFSAKHAALRRNSKDWLAWNQDNVYEWSDMSISGRLFQ